MIGGIYGKKEKLSIVFSIRMPKGDI